MFQIHPTLHIGSLHKQWREIVMDGVYVPFRDALARLSELEIE